MLAAASAPEGLVSWWTADNTTADLTTRNDATAVEGATFAAGKIGTAFDFDGINDGVQLPDSESLALTGSLSIEAWIFVRSLSPSWNGQILFRGDDRGGLDPYSLAVRSDGTVRFHVSSRTGSAHVSAPVPLNQFTHVAGTLDDATGVMRIYIDGVLAQEAVTTVRPFGDLDPDSNPGIGIGNHGGYPDSPHNFPFDGLVDELAIYSRALTAAEVQAIYDAGDAGKIKMVVAKTDPDLGSVVSTVPTSIVVDFSNPYQPASVQPSDLRVNGIAATSLSMTDADTVTFDFNVSPVTAEGIQSIRMDAGAVIRVSDGLGLGTYDATFRYDVVPMEVTSTDPLVGGALEVEQLSFATTAILSMAGMDGGNGGWPVLFGPDVVTGNSLQLAIDEDQLGDLERSHTTEQVGFLALQGTPTGDAAPYLRTGNVSGVGTSWTTVTLDRSYTSMVVVATPNYDSISPPLVTRIQNASDDSFEVRVQRTDGLTDPVGGVTVHYMVVEEGTYTQAADGVTLEAVKFSSTVTDRAGDGNIHWIGESRNYANTYDAPVVLGQVMSANDPSFSSFWARGSDRGAPPSPTELFVGKHVGEDPLTTRLDETIGYVVIEGGTGTFGAAKYFAGVGSDVVQGMQDSPPFRYGMTRTSLRVEFNEPYDPATLGVDDVIFSEGTVASATVVDAFTAEYTLIGVAENGVSVTIAAGALTDLVGNPMLPFAADYTTAFQGPIPIIPQGDPVPSASVQGHVDNSTGSDEFSLLLSAGQTISLVVTADEPALQLQLSVSSPSEQVVAQVDAALPGDSVLLQTVPAENDGVYRIQVEDLLAGSGDYTLEAWINAAVEEEPITGIANDTLPTAQDVNAAFFTLFEPHSIERAVVVGTSEKGQPDAVFFASGDVPIAVGAAQVVSTLTVPDDLVVGDLNVRLDVEHTYLEDLEVFLVSPLGTQVPLFAALQGARNEHLDVTFDDEAIVSIEDANAPYDGSTDGSGGLYRPSGSLTGLGGENAAGVWTLLVNDTYPLDDGTLLGWGLEITTQPVDTDLYQFTATTDQAIAATVETGGSYAQLELLDMGGTVLESVAGTDGPVLNFLAAEAGTYFVRVNVAKDYTLLVYRDAFLETPDNNSFATATPLPGEGTVIGNLGSQYTETSGPLNRLGAEAEAASLGGHLATIGDQAEQDRINEATGNDLYWIGFSDEAEEGNWVWVTGETVTYTNWRAGEPNNAGGDEHFAFTATTGWNDVDQNEIHPGIIETAGQDFFEITLIEGETLNLATETPGDDDPTVTNIFDPRVQLYDASQQLVAEDDDGAADGKNASLTFVVPEGAGGTYFALVLPSTQLGGTTAGDYLLSVAIAGDEPVPGDADGDGDVDGNDFLAWQTGFGTTSGAQLRDGDFDGDEDVDGNDFLIWQANFGTGLGGGGSAEATDEAVRRGPARDEALSRTRMWTGRRMAISPQRDNSLRPNLIDAALSDFSRPFLRWQKGG